MSSRRTVARNVIWNCAGMGVTTLVGFVVAPFLINRLGDTTYGLWIVIGSLTSYCGLLEMGVRGSIGRHIAYHRARTDQQGVNETISTGLFLLTILGLIGLLALVIILPMFSSIFHGVPAEQMAGVRLALVIVGLNLVISLALDTFDAALWGFQRFDLLNGIEIPTSVMRAVLVFVLIGNGGGLAQLAAITLGVTILNGLAKIVCSFREERALRLRPAYIRWRAVREIFGYSIWTFIGAVTRMTSTRLIPLLIGSILTVELIVPFAIASSLIASTASVMVAATNVLTPWATVLFAQDSHEAQRRLLVQAGRYCTALALYFLTLLLLLGGPLIGLWVGPHMAAAVPLLFILALGEFLPNSQYVTNGTIMAAGRHRMLAVFYLVETAAVVTLTVLLLRPFGLIGACFGLAIPAVLCRGCGQIVQGCRLTGVELRRFLVTALLTPIACAALPAALLAGVVYLKAPATWPQLVLYTALFTVVYAAAGVLLVGYQRVQTIGTIVFTRLSGLRRTKPRVADCVPGDCRLGGVLGTHRYVERN